MTGSKVNRAGHAPPTAARGTTNPGTTKPVSVKPKAAGRRDLWPRRDSVQGAWCATGVAITAVKPGFHCPASFPKGPFAGSYLPHHRFGQITTCRAGNDPAIARKCGDPVNRGRTCPAPRPGNHRAVAGRRSAKPRRRGFCRRKRISFCHELFSGMIFCLRSRIWRVVSLHVIDDQFYRDCTGHARHPAFRAASARSTQAFPA